MRTRATVLLSLILSWMPVHPALAERLDEILVEMQKAGNSLETLAADFVQTDHDYILKDEAVSEGKLYLHLPGRVRWEHSAPSPKVLLIVDELVRVYNPTANQVQEIKRGKSGSSFGGDLLVGFGKSNENIGKNYDATLVEERDDAVVLKLVPKPDSTASIFTAIELTLDKKTWTPTRSVFHEPNRDRTDIRFDNVSLNEKLPGKIFELDLPADVEILRN